jgi:thioredoxin reductase (NADPH)
MFNKTVIALNGENTLESIVIKDSLTDKIEVFETESVFVAIGQEANNEPFKNVCNLDNAGFIISNDSCTSEVEGIFVAGDCRQKRIRQISTAISDGTIAAVEAIKYLDR